MEALRPETVNTFVLQVKRAVGGISAYELEQEATKTLQEDKVFNPWIMNLKLSAPYPDTRTSKPCSVNLQRRSPEPGT